MTRQDEVRHQMGEMERAIYNATQKFGSIDKKGLVASCCYAWGMTSRYVKEYLKILIDMGKVKDEKGLLIWVDNGQSRTEQTGTEE
tara:strand:- start:170 stop:427 length:258 start_codon:yes stop_codon:yes gene_type:complete